MNLGRHIKRGLNRRVWRRVVYKAIQNYVAFTDRK